MSRLLGERFELQLPFGALITLFNCCCCFSAGVLQLISCRVAMLSMFTRATSSRALFAVLGAILSCFSRTTQPVIAVSRLIWVSIILVVVVNTALLLHTHKEDAESLENI